MVTCALESNILTEPEHISIEFLLLLLPGLHSHVNLRLIYMFQIYDNVLLLPGTIANTLHYCGFPL